MTLSLESAIRPPDLERLELVLSVGRRLPPVPIAARHDRRLSHRDRVSGATLVHCPYYGLNRESQVEGVRFVRNLCGIRDRSVLPAGNCDLSTLSVHRDPEGCSSGGRAGGRRHTISPRLPPLIENALTAPESRICDIQISAGRVLAPERRTDGVRSDLKRGATEERKLSVCGDSEARNG